MGVFSPLLHVVRVFFLCPLSQKTPQLDTSINDRYDSHVWWYLCGPPCLKRFQFYGLHHSILMACVKLHWLWQFYIKTFWLKYQDYSFYKRVIWILDFSELQTLESLLRPQCVSPRKVVCAVCKLYATLQEATEPESQWLRTLLFIPVATSWMRLCRAKFVHQKTQPSRYIQCMLRAYWSHVYHVQEHK